MWEFEHHDGAIPCPMPKLIATAVTKVVRTAGVEPARGLPLRILSPVCLPVPPRPHEATVPEILSPGNAIHGEDQLRVLKGSGLVRLP